MAVKLDIWALHRLIWTRTEPEFSCSGLKLAWSNIGPVLLFFFFFFVIHDPFDILVLRTWNIAINILPLKERKCARKKKKLNS